MAVTDVVALNTPVRRFWRTVSVIALAVFVLTLLFGNIAGLWIPSYYLGISTDPSSIISDVTPGSAADKAGVRVGDRMDFPSMTLSQKIRFSLPRPDEPLTVYLIHGDRRRQVTLTAEPIFTNIYLLIKRVTGIIFTLLGMTLVLVRPSRMTWGFYLYALSAADTNSGILAHFSPALGYAGILIAQTLYAVRPVGFLVFALRFPNDTAAGWKLWLDRSAPVLFAILLFARVVYGEVASTVFNVTFGQNAVNELLSALSLILIMLAAVALLDTYMHASGDARQRMKWVLAGLTISFFIEVVYDVGSFFPSFYQLAWLYAGYFRAAQIIVPITVAYAILRYRVLDVTFVISKTLVYGLMTSILVVIFSLIDWIFVRKLENTQLGLGVDIATAIGLGFWLNGLHHRVDALVESVFFRKRHLAEVQLSRVAATLPHTTSRDVLNELIVHEPAHALQLASAALFERASDGVYRRSEAFGWGEATAGVLDANDRLVLHLQAEQDALRIHHIRWPRTDLPGGAAYPVVAVPVLVRRQVVAIALYGAHVSSADLDPDEVNMLASLAVGAASAYDHLEAQDLRSHVQNLQRKLEAALMALEHVRHGPGSSVAYE